MPNPFVRPIKRPQCAGTNFVPVEDDLIYEYEVKDKLIRTGKGDFDFVTKQVVVLARKYSRSDAINEHADEVGILNIRDKVLKTGDVTLYNQRIPEFNSREVVDPETQLNDAINAKSAYGDLPQELTGGKSFSEFTKDKLSDAEIEAYVKAEVQKRLDAAKASEVPAGGEENA